MVPGFRSVAEYRCCVGRNNSILDTSHFRGEYHLGDQEMKNDALFNPVPPI